MARLIDADKVIASVKSQVALCRLFSHADGLMHEDDMMGEIIDMLEKCFIQEIDNARTVYAVPTVFIRSWLAENTFDPELGSHLAEALIQDWRKYEQRKP